MLLIKDEKQWWNITKVRTLTGYTGVCNNCGTPVEYPDPFEAMIIKQDYNMDVLFPLIHFKCPSCLKNIEIIYRYNSMDVTAELNMLKKE